MPINREDLYALSPEEQSEFLLIHLEMNLAGLKEIRKNINDIRSAANGVAVSWSRPMEAMMAHLELDISYIAGEIEIARKE